MIKSTLRDLKKRYVKFRLEAGEQGIGQPSAPPLILPNISADKSYNVGIVGAGAQGLAQARAIQKINGINLVGLADISPERLKQTAEILKLPTDSRFVDAEELFRKNSGIDLISIATTAPSHVKLGRVALNYGVKNILLEKPMDTSLEDARRFTEECKKSGVRLSVNYSRRWMVDYRAIKRCIEKNYIGEPRHITVALGKGELAMHASHYFDLCCYVLQSKPATVTAQLNDVKEPNVRGEQYYDPSGFCVITFENGARAFLDFSADLIDKHPFILIRGTAGQITVDEKKGFWTLQSRSQRVWSFPFAEALKAETLFSRVICELLSNKEPMADGDAGVMSLELILAAHLSNEQNGKIINLPLSDSETLPEVLFP